jgi:riboflavin kinase / FMN adenylyltransferase
MRILEGISDCPDYASGAALAIGNFDGVHRGHRVVIKSAIEAARQLVVPSGVMIFEPHPREYFKPDEPHFRLTSLDEKLRVFDSMGLDLAIVVPFDASFAELDYRDFTGQILAQRFRVRHVSVGYDFFYGKGRHGSPATLVEAGKEFHFGVSIVAPVADQGEAYSSTAIRLKLARGDVAGAAHDLGRNWRIRGRVVGGAKRGTGLGYPTANVPMPKGTVLGHGIYAVRAEVDGQCHDAAAYLGTRPTFDDGKPVLEVFLLDFDGDLYGHDMSVEFIGFVRGDRKFDSAEALVEQMDRDVAQTRDLLASNPIEPPRHQEGS